MHALFTFSIYSKRSLLLTCVYLTNIYATDMPSIGVWMWIYISKWVANCWTFYTKDHQFTKLCLWPHDLMFILYTKARKKLQDCENYSQWVSNFRPYFRPIKQCQVHTMNKLLVLWVSALQLMKVGWLQQNFTHCNLGKFLS